MPVEIHPIERKFTNELGNKIKVRVIAFPDGDVMLEISGPESMSENLMTRTEAENVLSALNEAMAPPR